MPTDRISATACFTLIVPPMNTGAFMFHGIPGRRSRRRPCGRARLDTGRGRETLGAVEDWTVELSCGTLDESSPPMARASNPAPPLRARRALPLTGRIHFRRDRHVKQRGRGDPAHWQRCGTNPRTARAIFRPISSAGRADISRSPAPLPGGRTNRRKHLRWCRFHAEGRS